MADTSHFVKNFKKNVAYRCEMDRNEIESDFRTSKTATGSHFVTVPGMVNCVSPCPVDM